MDTIIKCPDCGNEQRKAFPKCLKCGKVLRVKVTKPSCKGPTG